MGFFSAVARGARQIRAAELVMEPSARRALGAEISLLALSGVFRTALQYRLRPDSRVALNLAFGAASLGVAAAGGATKQDMGLEARTVGRGLAVGLGAVGFAAVSTAALVALPSTRSMFNDPMALDARPRHVAYETVVRIPLGTAVFEEALFRGALLGLERRWLPPGWQIPVNSLHFGIWHINEGVRQWLEPDLHSQLPLHSVKSVIGTVVATGAGGTMLALERELSGSLVAPIIGHAATNSFAYLGAVWVVHVLGEEPMLPEEADEPDRDEALRHAVASEAKRH